MSAISALHALAALALLAFASAACLETHSPMFLYVLSAPISVVAFVLQYAEGACAGVVASAAGTSTAANANTTRNIRLITAFHWGRGSYSTASPPM